MFMQLSVSSFPHLPKYTWYLVIYTSRIGEKYSISHHLGDKSQSGAFYPPNISLCTTLVDGCIHKSYTIDFIWVNNENLWSPKALIGKIWVNSSHSYFYPKNCQVSTSKELSKTKKKHKFSLNSVNGGHSFFVSNKIESFYYKLHPNVSCGPTHHTQPRTQTMWECVNIQIKLPCQLFVWVFLKQSRPKIYETKNCKWMLLTESEAHDPEALAATCLLHDCILSLYQ